MAPNGTAHVRQQKPYKNLTKALSLRLRGKGSRVAAPARLLPTTMLPRRARMSGSEVASARMAMISEDTVMSKPVSLQPHRALTLPGPAMEHAWPEHLCRMRPAYPCNLIV